jgi:hypothetical protein
VLLRIYQLKDDTEPWFQKSAMTPLIIMAKTMSGIFSIALPEKAKIPRDSIEMVHGEAPYETARKVIIEKAREIWICVKKKGYPETGFFYGTFNLIYQMTVQNIGIGSRVGICYCPQEATPGFRSVSVEDIEFSEVPTLNPTRFEREDVI